MTMASVETNTPSIVVMAQWLQAGLRGHHGYHLQICKDYPHSHHCRESNFVADIHCLKRFNNSNSSFKNACKAYHQEPNSDEEIASIYEAIQLVAKKTLVDHRFILAVMMQESGGCVRAPTSTYGVSNPGMMQDHNGTATCNNGDMDGIQNPCSADMVLRMVQDGTGGTDWGDGLAQCINKAETNDVSAFYRAARIYNSGSVDDSGDLEDGIATHCYVSDIANRLTGWTKHKHDCELDE